MNEYYSKDLSKKVEARKYSIWAQGGFSEGTLHHMDITGLQMVQEKALIDEEVSDNVVRIFNMFWMGRDMLVLQKTFFANEGILSPRNTDSISQERLDLLKKQERNGTIRM